jgi:mannose-6-phosphate isomerase-like protein (cupin superfamily)
MSSTQQMQNWLNTARQQMEQAVAGEAGVMKTMAVNLKEKFTKFSDHWAPKVIAQMNDYQFKLVKIEGDFVWHSHSDTDEVFIVLEGEMAIEFRDGIVPLKAGEMYVVPKGVEHKPLAKAECKMMLVEPCGVVNTGNTGGSYTAPNDVWI